MKKCRKCEKDDVSFYKDKNASDGYRSICKACDIEKAKTWNKKNHKKHAAHEEKYRLENPTKMKLNKSKYVTSNQRSVKNSSLKYNYDINIDRFELMKAEQGFSCAICNKHENDLSRPLCVDHSHFTGKVRSLLCAHCNSALGLIEENVDTAKKLVKYLEDHNG
jgi:hypothetical protein